MTTRAVELNGLTQDQYLFRACMPAFQTSTAGGVTSPLAIFFDQGNDLSAQIIKASASAAAIASSAGLIFALSWVGLALLAF